MRHLRATFAGVECRPGGRPEGGPAGSMANGHAMGGAHAAQPAEGSEGAAASGRVALLGADLGGHRRACSSV